MLRLAVLAGVGLMLGACTTTVKLPLCPKVARGSYQAGETVSYVNKHLAAAAAARRIELTPLSSFAVEAKGESSKIDWLTAQYPFLVCGFDTAVVAEDGTVYDSCMNRAPDWMTLVASDHPETLMTDPYGYQGVCVITDVSAPLASAARYAPDWSAT